MVKLELLELLKQSYNSTFNQDFLLLKKIYPMIEELRTTERNDIRNENDIINFIQWIRDNKVDFNFELLKSKGKGYGLIAVEPIKQDDIILSIDQKLMITSQVDSNELLQFKAFPQLILIIKLIKEIKSETSFWKPYLSILPKPQEFTKLTLKEIEKRKGLSICHDSIKELFLRIKQFDIVTKLITVDFNTFEWARNIVISRQNPIVLLPQNIQSNIDELDLYQANIKPEPHLALIPLYDMVNHQSGELTGSFDISKNSATLYSGFNFQPGQEIKMSYGKRSNQDLFLYCNFVDADNCMNDQLKVFVTVPKGNLYKERLMLLEMFGMKEGYFTLGSPLMLKSGNLMAFLYTIYLEENILVKALSDSYLDFNNVSSSVHQKALIFLKTHLSVSQQGLDKIIERENDSLIKDLALIEYTLVKVLLKEIGEILKR